MSSLSIQWVAPVPCSTLGVLDWSHLTRFNFTMWQDSFRQPWLFWKAKRAYSHADAGNNHPSLARDYRHFQHQAEIHRRDRHCCSIYRENMQSTTYREQSSDEINEDQSLLWLIFIYLLSLDLHLIRNICPASAQSTTYLHRKCYWASLITASSASRYLP